jgi:Protein of unknown function (DUF3631)
MNIPQSEAPYGITLNDLKTHPHWLAWEERIKHPGDKPTKVPINPISGGHAQTDNPSTWSTRKEAERRSERLAKNGTKGGIGIVLGDLGDGRHLAGIDLDKCRDLKSGKTSDWAGEAIDRFDTYSEISPSGEGIKMFFLMRPADVKAARDLIGGKNRRSFSAGKHREIAIDFVTKYYTVTADKIKGGHDELRLVTLEDVKWLLEDLGPRYKAAYLPAEPEEGKSKAGARDESGSGYAHRFMREARARGDSYDAACAAILADKGQAGEWARRSDDRQLSRAWDSARPSSDKARIDALVKLVDPIEYDIQCKKLANELKCSPSAVKQAVAQRRESAELENIQTKFLQAVKPWDTPVDGHDLLNELYNTYHRHIIISSRLGYAALALWTLHAHAIDAARHSPILFISSPTKRCGKTNLLATISMLVPIPLSAANITPAVVFRAIDRWRPTMLIDESDTFISDKSELRGILNSGHTRSQAYVLRVVGDDHVPKQFSTWAPKAFAGIGRIHPTLEDRSIIIGLKRKLPTEDVERLPKRGDAYFNLHRQCARWALDNSPKLEDASPEIPEQLNDRAADNWEPLLAIADICGGDWPKLARDAALGLSTFDDDQEYGIMLLEDLKNLFERGGDDLTSKWIVAELGDIESRPWPEFGKGKAITTRGLAKLLAPFKIKPVQLWIDKRHVQGYEADDFKAVFKRIWRLETKPATK